MKLCWWAGAPVKNSRFWGTVVVKLNLVERQSGRQTGPKTVSPLSVIDAISAGFDHVTRRPRLLLMPLALDVFLWMGPRLLAAPLADQLARSSAQLAADLDASSRIALQEMVSLMREMLSRVNLMSWLSVTGVGVPAANTGLDATKPLPTGSLPPIEHVPSLEAYLFVMISLTLVGLMLAGLFWSMLAGSVRGDRFDVRHWLLDGLRVGLQLAAVAALAIGLMLALAVPASLLIVMLGSLSLGLASLVPALLMAIMMWGILFAVFTVHGLALYRFSVQRAVVISGGVLRAFFSSTVGFVVLGLAIYIGLGLIWELIAADSWLRLIAMPGNAFVGTGLLVASLHYYQDRTAILFERLNWPQPLGNARG